jgi:hypothetical protein
MMIEKLGVDVGGVIIDRINDNTDTSFFSDNYLATTAVPGAFEALARLSAEQFDSRVFLVSKCGPRVEAKTREWLAHHDFHGRTGIAADRLHFCRQRRDKAGICETLGITHFVDDRLEVLGYLTSVPNRYLFQPNLRELQRHKRHLSRVHRVESWQEVLDLIL